jgi:hypothetical protein
MNEICSKPEPSPKNIGEEVTPSLINWINNISDDKISNIIKTNVIQLIVARDTFGLKKYGQRLKTKDGRDSQEDAMQELGDLMQYIYKAKMNGESIEKIKEISSLLIKLIDTL